MYKAIYILCAADLHLVINIHSLIAFLFFYCILIYLYCAAYILSKISLLFT